MPQNDVMGRFTKDEIFSKDGNDYLLLRGLRRIAQEDGVKKISTQIIKCPSMSDYTAVAICTYEFNDGTICQGAADATPDNCTGIGGPFKTAMADTRAEARCLRRRYNISMCSFEEVQGAPAPDFSSNKDGITSQQEAAIMHIAKRKSITGDGLSEIIHKKIGKKCGVKDLGREDAIKLLEALNS